AARLVTTVAEAVQHAHDRGVLHRDLKPNNVILQATKEDPDQTEPPPGSCYLRGECFVPRLVDFGLAKLLERGGPSETTTRQILGTPKYMAPEQALAKHDDIGPAADVYALGVILYEMLAGRAPFEGATDVEVLRQAIDGHLVNPRQLRRDVPRDLEAICLKAMDRSPAHRYRTAIDLADDLRRFLEGKPTIARPLKWPGRAGRWLRRNDQAVALIVVTVVTTLLLVLGSWSIYQNQQFRTYHDTTVQKQAEQTRSDQQRGYAQSVRSAFLAWRAGDIRGASEYLDAARKHAATGGEPVDFPHSYLARLIAAERLTIVCPAGAITTLGISPDGSQLATGHADGTIALWESTGGAAIATGTEHESSVTFLRFQAPGEILSADVRGNPKSWLLRGRSLTPARSPMPGPEFAAPPTLLVRHGNTIYSAGAEGVVHAWDTAADAEISVSASFEKPVTALALDAAGGSVALATAASELIRCDGGRFGASLKTGNHHFSFLRLADSLTGIELREDGVALWELMPAIKETKWLPITGRGARITTADLSPDKSFLAIGDSLGQVSVISIFEGGMTSKTGIGAGNPIDRVALADNGRLAAATTPAGVEVWSVGSSTPVATLGVFDPTAMRFLPGSDRLATAGVGGVVRVWSVATTIEEWTLYGHVGRVTAIGASPDGRTLVTGSASGELKLWDLRTGQELMAFQRYGGPVQWIEFAERGRVMVTVGQGRGGSAELIYWKGMKD
ncbi:MAG TPA: serine/threonine-protein kinase, partial [Gemmata sp.]|nr:serine/threonine-protein kinase [Gemmata sp.]